MTFPSPMNIFFASYQQYNCGGNVAEWKTGREFSDYNRKQNNSQLSKVCEVNSNMKSMLCGLVFISSKLIFN